ncbi:uncharacterized protein AB675_11115 [Cyphellophora attinorum]|uniref:Uncharacterized protein n=1 Tax=Cyphellophora attinorum TaxID=1664694 RepID=A0A0N0NII3_9EURO|nr:uncharacterized protein AB675_11115 [Phialophora attinorum]KPI35871.1 hypothetical protein AB675_11115 [Phialophora attinorum]
MPGKYSYNLVLADYSSQGLISLPNDQQLQYLREDQPSRVGNTKNSTYRPRGPSGRPETALSHASGQDSSRRVVIVDSDTSDDEVVRVEQDVSQQQSVERSAELLARNVGEDGGDRAALASTHQAVTNPQPHVPHPDSNDTSRKPRNRLTKPRRSGGVRALIQARYNEELAAAIAEEESAGEPVNHTPVGTEKGKNDPQLGKVEAAQTNGASAQDDAASAAINKLSLHEFLDTVPRSPRKPKWQPRGPQREPGQHVDRPHTRSISVQEFLSLEPGPVTDGVATAKSKPSTSTEGTASGLSKPSTSTEGTASEIRKPAPPLNKKKSSPNLVSRLPRNVSSQHQRPASSPQHEKPQELVMPRASVDKPADPAPSTGKQTERPRSPDTDTVRHIGRSPSPQKPAEKDLRQHGPVRPVSKYMEEPDFDGFSDVDDDSYFPAIAHYSSAQTQSGPPANMRRSSSVRTSSHQRRDKLSQVLGRPSRPSSAHGMDDILQLQHDRESAVQSRQRMIHDVASAGRSRTPIGSPELSLTTASSSTSPFPRTPKTNMGASGKSSRQARVKPSGSTESWGLPNIVVSDDKVESLSQFLGEHDESKSSNVMIFTSDEEEEDDYPTPRLQRLEEDVQMAPAKWGTISSGRQVNFTRKDADTMSEISAVYPPDIGRYTSNGEAGGPLATALAGMRHGGELGATYKPGKSSRFRRSMKPGDLLQKLGLKDRTPPRPIDSPRPIQSTTTPSASSPGGARYYRPPMPRSASSQKSLSSKSGWSGSSSGRNPKYHPSSSSRGRLPKNDEWI